MEGQATSLYYRLARHWMAAEIALDQARQPGGYLEAARSVVHARPALQGLRRVSIGTEA